jgi:hypothetical protein
MAERRLGDLSLRGEPICEQCAGQQARRAAWWRLVYSVIGRHRCAACGREFGVTRRATGTAELAATEMDRLTPSQREHFDAQMALMRRRFDETHRQPTGVEYGTWPVPGAQSPARPVHTPRSAAQPVSPRIPLTDMQHDRLWTVVIIVILAGVAVLFNLACIRAPLPYSPAGVANPPPPSPHPAIALPAAPWWVTNAQAFVEANCK